MKTNIELLVVGHTAVDLIMEIEEFPEPNSSVSANNLKKLKGGAAANVAVVGATLGLKTGLLTAAGEDFQDSEYKKKFDELEIDTSATLIAENETFATAVIINDKENNQTTYFSWGASKLFKEQNPQESIIEKSQAVHLATGDPIFTLKCARIANKLGKTISFDPGQDLHLYNKETLLEVIKLINILFCNHHEIHMIEECLGKPIPEILKMGPEIIIKTCGEKGSYIYTGDEVQHIPANIRKCIDPTGAGDSYKAGFLSEYLKTGDVINSAKLASSVASFIIEKQGTQTNIPSKEDAIKRMQKQ